MRVDKVDFWSSLVAFQTRKTIKTWKVMGPSGAGKSLLLHSLCGLAPSNAMVFGTPSRDAVKMSLRIATGDRNPIQ